MSRASWWSVIVGLAGIVALVFAYLLWVATPQFPIVPFLGGVLGGVFIGASGAGLVLTSRAASERKPIPTRESGLAQIDQQLVRIRTAIVSTEGSMRVAARDIAQWGASLAETSRTQLEADRLHLQHLAEQEQKAVAEKAKVSAMTERQWRAYVRKKRR